MITITIINAVNGQQLATSRHRTDDVDVAIERAIKRGFGQRSRFYEDCTITGSTPTCRFGRIVHTYTMRVVSVDYGHVRIDISPD